MGLLFISSSNLKKISLDWADFDLESSDLVRYTPTHEIKESDRHFRKVLKVWIYMNIV